MIRNMELEFLHGLLAISIRETSLKMKDKVTERCIGLMVVLTKVNGLGVFNTEKVLWSYPMVK